MGYDNDHGYHHRHYIGIEEKVDFVSFEDIKNRFETEWSEQIRLLGEKETLGLYLTGHPIQRYQSELKHFTTDRISELRPTGNQAATIAGIVTQLRAIQTKRGDRMAVVSLEDASGQIDVLCFAENYQKYRELLVKDKLIIVVGEISIDDFNGGYRVLVREIFSINEARERHGKYLQIRLSQEQALDIGTLSKILEPYRGGKCAVTIHYHRDNAAAQLKLGETWRVNPSDDLLQKLRDIYIEENVEMVY